MQNRYQDMNEYIKMFVYIVDKFDEYYNSYPLIKEKADVLFSEAAIDNPQFGSIYFWVNRGK